MKILLIILLILFGIQLITNKDGRFALNTLVQQVINIFYWFADRPRVTLVGFIVLAVLFAGNSRGKHSENAKKTDPVAIESLTETQNQVERTAEKISKEEKTKKNVSATCDSPVWSKEYLFWYVEKNDIPGAGSEIESAQKYIDRAEQSRANGSIYLKLNKKIFEENYFSITSEETEYVYSGELKDNRPSGFGALWKVQEGKELILYCGNFSSGRYDGYGVKFKTYSDDTVKIVLAKTLVGMLASRNYRDYLETITYIGAYSNGKKAGSGVGFVYPDIKLAWKTLESDGSDLTELTVYTGTFKEFGDDAITGEVKIYTDGNLMYEGEMKNSEYSGEGILYFPDNGKIMYDGHWKRGEYDGSGTLYDENGEIIYSGKWDNGDYAS